VDLEVSLRPAQPTRVPRNPGLGRNRGTDPHSKFAGPSAARPAFANSRVLSTDREDEERSEPDERPGDGENQGSFGRPMTSASSLI
jgi:hypothetical protein